MESVLVKLQAFNINGSDGVRSMFLSPSCCCLFLVNSQVFTINGSDGVM